MDTFDIAKLSLEPGDILVGRIKREMYTEEMVRDVYAALRTVVEHSGLRGVTVLVGPDDVELSILRKGDGEIEKAA